ncbi:MAG: hypothetical protein CMB76_07530 [Euryarchaeota archaeon]|nr:hypothetical protein [Euryarchaeota archaeon]|tara:strand:- start:3839 stop:4261 length:423 start_codon:yes stop_codon:yes gene_type:complete
MAFSQYFATEILTWIKGSSFPTALSNVYVSIHTGDPGTAGTSNDVTLTVTGSSNRTAISASAFTGVTGASPSGFEIKNTNTVQITTNAQNGTQQTLSHFGLWDAQTSGNFIASGALTANVDVQSGDTVQFNANALAIKVV